VRESRDRVLDLTPLIVVVIIMSSKKRKTPEETAVSSSFLTRSSPRPPFIVWFSDWDEIAAMCPAQTKEEAEQCVDALEWELELSPVDHRGQERSVRFFITDGYGQPIEGGGGGGSGDDDDDDDEPFDMKEHSPQDPDTGEWIHWRGWSENASEISSAGWFEEDEVIEFIRGLNRELGGDFSVLKRIYPCGDYDNLERDYTKAFKDEDSDDEDEDEEEDYGPTWPSLTKTT